MSPAEPAPAPHEDALQAAARHAPALHSTQRPAHPERLQLTVSAAFGCPVLYYPHNSHNCFTSAAGRQQIPFGSTF